MAKFTVDTHLFRELGELLVGRDSTALVELIKNAYDADATKVIVHGQHLDDTNRGKIIIKDDGIGMSPDHFTNGFLRIASRLKEEKSRKSLLFKRRFTGAKGIGRLSAHKLARFIHIHSVPSKDVKDNALSVDASIDWDIVESMQTLDQLDGSEAIQFKEEIKPLNAEHGTTITLRRLRRRWTPTERAKFFAEVQTFSPPASLIRLPSSIVDKPLLFGAPKIASKKSSDPGFDVSLVGEFEAGESYWQVLAQAAQWVIEVDARRPDGKIKINIVPTKMGEREFPEARQRFFKMAHPCLESGPFFHARILVREGRSNNKEEKAWFGRSCGIRVYMEGFRVLPYGEPNDDWLSIDSDYKQRQKTLSYLSGMDFAGAPSDENEGLQILGNSAYFGAAFLTLPASRNLKMLVNREGFLQEEGYESLVHILRTAVHLSVRVRAAAKLTTRMERSEDRKYSTRPQESPLELRQAVELSVKRASNLASEARKLAAEGDFKTAKQHIDQAAAELSEGSHTSQRIMTEGAILRVLASVGTQMAAFVHEINSLVGLAVALEGAINRIMEEYELPTAARKQIAKLQGAIGELRRSVERQASYLSDVVTPDARRRRVRQRLAERFDAGRRLIENTAQRRGIEIINEIPPDLKSPPMFQAEITLIFSNLLTNAVKAAGRNGRILAHAKSYEDGSIALRIENSGVQVDLSKGERWFRPFESTTAEADPILGQGMGMGLPITRNMLEQYGAEIHFVEPRRGYTTALEIIFQK